MGRAMRWGCGMNKRPIKALAKDRRGATAVEYALILGLIFLAIIGGLSQFASVSINMWNYISDTAQEAHDRAR